MNKISIEAARIALGMQIGDQAAQLILDSETALAAFNAFVGALLDCAGHYAASISCCSEIQLSTSFKS